MSKWIAGLLLLANLALFGWMRWGGMLTEDGSAMTAQIPLNEEKIRLLEIAPASAVAPDSVPALQPAAASAVANVPSGTKSGGVASMAPPQTSAPVPISIPLAPLRPTSAQSASPSADKPAAGHSADCIEWGEFSGKDLLRAQQSLAMLKLGEDLSQRTVEQNHAYWVYIPPLKKRSDVERKIAQLKQRGVKDYFVVKDDKEWQNAISLGLFKSKEAAQNHLAVLRTQDVRSARIGERSSKLKFTVFIVKEPDSGTADKLKALHKEFTGSELKVTACRN
ncbi:MAG TPA: SPOR domain-containing protein [Sideroxyarcus sp.]|nr:SPOR domain-containing protein [Sideroxyarcus sp.]